jgi:hypothetical protein
MIDWTKRKVYWVLFRHGQHWTQTFLKKDFGHVAVLTRESDRWVMIDPTFSGLKVYVVKEVNPEYFNERYKHVIEVEVAQNNNDIKPSIPVLLSCLSITKYILGVNFFCVTPYGLFKKLIGLKNKFNYGISSIKVLK